MQVVETNSEALLKDFKVTVAAADIEARVDSRLLEVGQDVRIPGFRPGKAPVSVLKQRFGPAVRGEVLEALLRDSTQELLDERGLRPASQPKVEVTSYEEGNDLEYDLSVELLPDIGKVDFSSLELERLKISATDREIDETLQRLVEENRPSAPVTSARPAKSGDIVVLDYVGKVDDEPFDGGTGTAVELELGSGEFIPGFEDQLIGVKAGQSLDVTVTFPDDYDGELAGKWALFACEIKELREPVAVAPDDEFAKTLGFESLDALKDAIRGQLNAEYTQYAYAQTKRELLDKLAETHTFDVPPRMAESEFEQIWQQVEQARERGDVDPDDEGKSDEELRESYRSIAERRVRLGLLLSHVGESNDLTVTREEINRAIMEQARQMPGREQLVIDFYRNNADAQASLQAPIFEDKVVQFIIEMAKVTERELTPDEMRAQIEAESAAPEDSGEETPKKAATKKKTSAKSGGRKSGGKPAAEGDE